MASSNSYFAGTSGTAILAHRGLALGNVTENTLEAFSKALAAGATHIETDVQATRDGVAVLFHDRTLKRLLGDNRKVSQVDWSELSALAGATLKIPTLQEALSQHREVRFNLDVKTSAAVKPVAQLLAAGFGQGTVLVSSFSGRRRRRVLRLLSDSGAKVATSAHAILALRLLVLARLRMRSGFGRLAAGIDAVQVPSKMGILRFDHPRFVDYLRQTSTELHYWTINEPLEMQRLVELGATGVVTDRTDLAHATLK